MLYLINFKTYREGTGRNALKLARIMSGFRKRIIAAVQPADIRMVSKVFQNVYAQHIDPIEYGSHTGWILPESIKDAGARGTLISHSERTLNISEIKRCIKRAREVGLKTVVCAPTPARCRRVAKFNPDYIAIEPPELIGTGRSVSKEKPEVISRARRLVPERIPLLCGAGISMREDVVIAKELGCAGVLVSSAVVKSKDRRKALQKLFI
ncbi:MAG: triose-phosphate isomerase [Candidatus Aenigmatarchaeota archaeon]|nr:MAG: triose-phosphate isomerase [Candidatus Aenigmarchaeota archaeon]